MRTSAVWLIILAAYLLGAARAQAARTSYLQAEQAEILPEGEVELEQWLWADGRVPAAPARPVTQWVWWGPVVGVTPHLELAFPLELVSASDALSLSSLGVDLRYRLFPQQDDRPFQPLLHVGFAYPMGRGGARATLDLVADYGSPASVQLTLNAGASWGLPFPGTGRASSLFLTSSAGLSWTVASPLRLSVEAYNRAPIQAGAGAADELLAGASLSWSRGPFWITLGSLFGLTSHSPRLYPKLLWAVEL